MTLIWYKLLGFTLLVLFISTVLIGCARQVEVFDCKCDCNNSVFECSSNERQLRTKGL